MKQKNKNAILKNPYSLYFLERKTLLFSIFLSLFLILLNLFFSFYLIFSIKMSLLAIPFIVMTLIILLFLIKNIINLFLLLFASNQLDYYDLNINIYFKWIRKRIGNIFFGWVFLFYWIIIFLSYHLIIISIPLESSNSNIFFLFFLFSIIIFIAHNAVLFFTNHLYNSNLNKTKNIIPMTQSFELEINLVEKQALKDYFQFLLLSFLFITIIPGIIYLSWNYLKRK